MTEPLKSIAIVGAGLAGASAATTLRSRGFSGEIHLIGAEKHLPYDRPPLSKDFLSGDLPEDRLWVHPSADYEEHEIELHLGKRVLALRPGERSVELEGGATISADRVLLCTGVRPRRLPVPGEALAGVHYLRDLEDALAVRSAVREGTPLVVVGEGFIGSEVASTLVEQGLAVTMLMGEDLPMKRVLGEDAAHWLLEQHRYRGVDVRPRSPMKAIHGTNRVEAVELVDGTVLPAGVVVIAVGSEPVAELASGVGADIDDGVLVDGNGRTSVPEVFAAGDVARYPCSALGRRIRVEHWQNAQVQAAKAAEAMLGDDAPHDAIPWAWSEQYGHRWEFTGLPSTGTQVMRRGVPDSVNGALWVFSDNGRVVGAVAVNRQRELRAVQRALGREVIFSNPTMGDESVDIRAALTSAA